jgi:hypothetical protein
VLFNSILDVTSLFKFPLNIWSFWLICWVFAQWRYENCDNYYTSAINKCLWTPTLLLSFNLRNYSLTAIQVSKYCNIRYIFVLLNKVAGSKVQNTCRTIEKYRYHRIMNFMKQSSYQMTPNVQLGWCKFCTKCNHICTMISVQYMVDPQCHHMSLIDFVASPLVCGGSVTDFWGLDAHEVQLRCPDEVDGDIWIWSSRRGLKPPPRPWSPWETSPSRKNHHGRTGIEPGTSWSVAGNSDH